MPLRKSLNSLSEAIQWLKSRISEKDTIISEKDTIISEKDTIISEKESSIHTMKTKYPWSRVTSSGADALGEFIIGEYNADDTVPNVICNKPGYFRMAEGYDMDHETGLKTTLPVGIFYKGETRRIAIDMSPAKYLNFSYYIPDSVSMMPLHVKRFLMPDIVSISNKVFYNVEGLTDGLYLYRDLRYINTGWIEWNTDVVIPVKCPPETCNHLYINKMGISIDDMVGIFNNLKDFSGTSTTKRVTLGTTNLAKLTDEQKNIAYAKGWELA